MPVVLYSPRHASWRRRPLSCCALPDCHTIYCRQPSITHTHNQTPHDLLQAALHHTHTQPNATRSVAGSPPSHIHTTKRHTICCRQPSITHTHNQTPHDLLQAALHHTYTQPNATRSVAGSPPSHIHGTKRLYKSNYHSLPPPAPPPPAAPPPTSSPTRRQPFAHAASCGFLCFFPSLSISLFVSVVCFLFLFLR